MKTVVELSRDVAIIVEKLGHVNATVTQARTLAELADTLDPHRASLEKVAQFSKEAIENRVMTDSVKVPGAESVAADCAELANELEEAGDPLVQPAVAAELRASIQSFSTNGRVVANEAWREYCRSNGPPEISEDFLSVFDDIHPDTAGALKDHLKTCEMNAEAGVPGTGVIKSFQASVAAIPGLLTEIVGSEPLVGAFIEALTTGGAPLDALTTEVKAWMEASTLPDGRSLVDLFRITLRGRAP